MPTTNPECTLCPYQLAAHIVRLSRGVGAGAWDIRVDHSREPNHRVSAERYTLKDIAFDRAFYLALAFRQAIPVIDNDSELVSEFMTQRPPGYRGTIAQASRGIHLQDPNWHPGADPHEIEELSQWGPSPLRETFQDMFQNALPPFNPRQPRPATSWPPTSIPDTVFGLEVVVDRNMPADSWLIMDTTAGPTPGSRGVGDLTMESLAEAARHLQAGANVRPNCLVISPEGAQTLRWLYESGRQLHAPADAPRPPLARGQHTDDPGSDDPLENS